LIQKQEKEMERSHTVTVTIAEVYNEQIRDLLVLPAQEVNSQINRIIVIIKLVMIFVCRTS